MSLYQDDDSQQADTEEFNEFEHYQYNYNTEEQKETHPSTDQTPPWNGIMREQKRSIVQSSIDKNLYFRDGDDA